MKIVAVIAGFILVALGAAFFTPGLAEGGVLFGTFPVSAPLAIAFIVTGVIGIGIGFTRRREFNSPRGEGRDMREWY
jgi:ABC-type Na+ efflux pump permease subunit